ncbi:MAG: 16S rRNA (cytidine(1402)-2'-O)-methyltransferase [Puniceicoccales bacterium]|jgi:16S rRNA (cytidine1402-2'-O)-methyltransferase|nr:16S rRNA (cytidine(1402)-2'-O)-methyltransferase [Puniceicoccales bacterium]
MAKLVIVPTPIGNLGDISPRAAKALAECDMVLCEDSRVCSKLLRHIGVTKDMVIYRDDNEERQVPKIIDSIRGGNVVCLTSDAGTPTISDPGYRIVSACRKVGIPVESIPGPCAITTVLAASGLPSDGFLFLGFLPKKSSTRISIFRKYASFDYTIVWYESCHRIVKFLDDLHCVVGGDRVVCIAKELTKLHEKFYIGKISKVRDEVGMSQPRGEYVAVVAPERFKL